MMFFGAKSTKLSLQGWGLKDAVCDQVLYLDTIDATRFDNNSFQRGMAISKDGLKLYFGVDSPSAIIQLSLSSAGDLSSVSATYTEQAVPALADNPMLLKFNDTGTVLMVADQTGTDDNNYIYQFSLTEGWDISTLTYEKKYRYDDATYDMQTAMLDLNPDGTKMYLALTGSSTSDTILRQFSLQTGWDLGTVTIDDSVPFAGGGNGLFDVEGKYLVATSNPHFAEYTFTDPWNISGGITKDPNEYGPCTIYHYGLGTSPHNGALFQLAKDPNDNYRNAITHINLPAPEDYDKLPPVADAGEDQTGVIVGDTVHLDGSGSYDTNNPPLPLYYNWTLDTKPAGSAAELNDPNIVNPTFPFDVDGSYTASLIVSNGKRSSVSDAVRIQTAGSGITARYWGIQNTGDSSLVLDEFEIITSDNGLDVFTVDPDSKIAGLTSYGDIVKTKFTDGDLTTGSLFPIGDKIKYDCAEAVIINFVRVAINGEPFKLLKSDDDITWYESDPISGYTVGSDQFNSDNYLDISTLSWTETI